MPSNRVSYKSSVCVTMLMKMSGESGLKKVSALMLITRDSKNVIFSKVKFEFLSWVE